MHFLRLTNSRDAYFAEAMALYAISFPHHEQRQDDSQRAIMSHPEYHFTVILEGEDFVGDILWWETEDFCYVEHFCILPALRGRRYGQQALELLGQRGKTVILEIDPPVDEVSLRRRGFYQRCGFVENSFPHIHPPYHQGNQGHALVVLSSPCALTATEYDAFKAYLDDTVMGI